MSLSKNEKDTLVSIMQKASSEDLSSIAEQLAFFRNAMQAKIVSGLRKGMKVQFTGRRGSTLTGTVEKINMKTVHVRVPATSHGCLDTVWRVSPSLLRLA